MNYVNSFLFLLLALSVVLGGCFNRPPKGTEAFYNRSYGPHQRNKLDVFLPETRDTNTATVLLLHGGAWVAGDKGGAEMKDIRNLLVNEGFAVASMNYRYACGDYTKQMDDVEGAISYIRSNSQDWKINNSRFALIGLSAGGHLSLLYAHAFDEENVIRTVISVVGPADFTEPIFRQYANNYNLWWTVETLLGTTLSENLSLYEDASPVYNWSDKPTFFIYGAQDDLVPAEHGIAMFDTLTVHGIATDTIVPPLGTHNVYGPNNMYKQQVETEMLQWLSAYLN